MHGSLRVIGIEVFSVGFFRFISLKFTESKGGKKWIDVLDLLALKAAMEIAMTCHQ